MEKRNKTVLIKRTLKMGVQDVLCERDNAMAYHRGSAMACAFQRAINR